MTSLTILGRVTSINVRKVLWAADEIGLSYEREDWGMPLRDPNEPAFLKLNPNAQVPVIVEDDFVLWESSAIMRYLAHKHRSGLLPPLARQQALVEQWLGWQASDLNGQWGYAVLALIRKAAGYDDPDRIAASIAGWTAKMRILEGHLQATGGQLAGQAFSLADIAIALSVHRWMAAPIERPQLPAVADYYDRMRERDAGKPYLGAATP
jgi:glutathione S-transferase